MLSHSYPRRPRKLSASGKSLTLADGYGTNAIFNYPTGIVLYDNQTLYVSDTNNNCIRTINVTSGKDSFIILYAQL